MGRVCGLISAREGGRGSSVTLWEKCRVFSGVECSTGVILESDPPPPNARETLPLTQSACARERRRMLPAIHIHSGSHPDVRRRTEAAAQRWL